MTAMASCRSSRVWKECRLSLSRARARTLLKRMQANKMAPPSPTLPPALGFEVFSLSRRCCLFRCLYFCFYLYLCLYSISFSICLCLVSVSNLHPFTVPQAVAPQDRGTNILLVATEGSLGELMGQARMRQDGISEAGDREGQAIRQRNRERRGREERGERRVGEGGKRSFIVVNTRDRLYLLLALVNHQHPSSGTYYGTAARAAIGAQQPLVEAAHMEAIVALLAGQNPAA